MKSIIALSLLLLLPAAFARDVKIVSWNVYMLPKPVKFSKQKQRTPVIIKALLSTEADVIVLQEAFSRYFEKYLRFGMRFHYPAMTKLGKSGRFIQRLDSGLMILSKFPMKRLGHVHFKAGSGADKYAAKGAVLVELEIDGKTLQIANTHLQAGRGDKKASQRRTQLAQIKGLLKKHYRPGVAQMLVGDFNIDALRGFELPAALEEMDMTMVGLPGPMQPSRAQNTACLGKVTSNYLSRYDYAWLTDPELQLTSIVSAVTPLTRVMFGRNCDLSDHHPVTIDFSF